MGEYTVSFILCSYGQNPNTYSCLVAFKRHASQLTNRSIKNVVTPKIALSKCM